MPKQKTTAAKPRRATAHQFLASRALIGPEADPSDAGGLPAASRRAVDGGLRLPALNGRPRADATLGLEIHSAIPPIPPPPGVAGAGFSGLLAIMTSVVMTNPATDEAAASAVRTTLVGSMIPAWTMFLYSPDCASAAAAALLRAPWAQRDLHGVGQRVRCLEASFSRASVPNRTFSAPIARTSARRPAPRHSRRLQRCRGCRPLS